MLNHIVKTLGPGLLFSGAAIGVSHLVMSTRAGATYGLCMLFFVVIANVFKYPFFQFGPRYAAATGNDLLDGYKAIGKPALYLFTVFTIATLFIFIAAVTIVTAGLAIVLLDLNITVWQSSLIVLLICCGILVFGHYHYLVKIIKVVIITLTLTTISAFILSFYTKYIDEIINVSANAGFIAPSLWSDFSISFIIALMGWMPAPIELSVWHSIWQLEKKKDNPTSGSFQGALLDFNIGYIGTAIIAMLFVSLGSFLLYGTGKSFPDNAIGFSQMLISIYTDALGEWVWWIIAIAAFTTMFSTTLTLLDAYARVMTKSLSIIFKNNNIVKNNNLNYNLWLIISAVGALIVLDIYIDNMKSLTTFATILSFMTAPVFAFLNYKVITDKHIPDQYRITSFNKTLSHLGLVFLTLVTLMYLFVVVIF